MSHGSSSTWAVTFELGSSTAETARLHAWLDAVFASSPVPEPLAGRLRLCLEEAVMNVVLHGYGEGRPGRIGLTLWREADALFARVTDAAPAFDPVSSPLPPLAPTLEAARLGGRGLRLIRGLATR
ncbi:MAG TPA: ATP-binding protein, partial [Acetobacteraceae bacterium]|nr:ATP-binding protein [Acetobacteraceae bacterium]